MLPEDIAWLRSSFLLALRDRRVQVRWSGKSPGHGSSVSMFLRGQSTLLDQRWSSLKSLSESSVARALCSLKERLRSSSCSPNARGLSRGSSKKSGDNLLPHGVRMRSGFSIKGLKARSNSRRARSGSLRSVSSGFDTVRFHLSPPRSNARMDNKQESTGCSNDKGLNTVSV